MPSLRFLFIACLLANTASASAGTIKLNAKDALLSGDDLHVVLNSAGKPRQYLDGFSRDEDFATFRIRAHENNAYEIFCLCRISVRKTMEIEVNSHTLSTIMHPASGGGFALQYLGIAELAHGENTITVHKGWGGFDLASLVLRPHVTARSPATVNTLPADSAATTDTRNLLRSLQLGYGKSTLVGVYADEDAEYVQHLTGKLPAIMGGDLMRYSPAFLLHSSNTRGEVERLIAAHQRGQIVTLSWHWASPMGARDTPAEPWFRSFYTAATTFDLRIALNDEGSPEHAALMRDMHQIAIQLRRLQDAGVPVLWRPLHEAEDEDFWWGAKGSEPFQALWKLLYHQLTDVEGIHNLLWVFTSSGDMAWYPGDAYVDIISIDGYPRDIHDAESTLWTTLQQRFVGRRLLAISEFGGIPDLPKMQQFGEWWSYAVSWSDTLGPRKNDPAELKQIILSPNTGTLRPSETTLP